MMLATLSTLGLAAAASSWYLAPHAARRLAERRLRHSCAQSGTLCLTFDDGPGPELTPRLLDLLAERGALAAFFPLGRQVRAHPELIDRIQAEGHTLGCHTDQHRNAWRCLPGVSRRDIDAGYRTLAPWIHDRAPFRPPYGKMTVETWRAIQRRGAPLAWWTVDSLDSRETLPTPQSVVDNVEARGGGIVLLHDNDRGPKHREFVLDLVSRLLDTAEQHGWHTANLPISNPESIVSHAA